MADAEDTFRRAADHHRQGRLDEAEALYRQILDDDPDHADANHMLGVAACQRGEFEQGADFIAKAIKTAPKDATYHNNLGSALKELGRTADAVASYEAALAIDPNLAEAHYNTGNIHMHQGRAEDARQCFEQALAIKSDYAEARSNLGNVLKKLGRLEDAVDCYETVLDARPDLAEVHFNLGNTLNDLGRPEDATGSYQKALALNPDYAEAHANMGNAYKEQGRLNDAAACYRNALAITPDSAEALNNLGTVLKEQDRWHDAIECYQTVLGINPDYVEALHNLGGIYGDLGRTDEAVDCYRRAGKIEGDNTRADIKAALLLPPILSGLDVIAPLRQALADKVEAINGNGHDLKDPHRVIGKTGFYLAYHGLDDRDVQRQIADMYLRVAPSLAFETATAPAPAKDRRIRVGIVSAHLHSHTIGKIYSGVIENLDRQRFEVIIFRTRQQQDAIADAIDRAADRVIALNNDLDLARRRIAEESIDVLFYPDIGMEPFTYFLAFARLAPVQLAGWGHPVTTGIANVDYFLSSQDLEPPGADDHYTERLVRLAHLPAFYTRPPPVSSVGRDHFGLPEDARLYVIPQTLFKFHPSFDSVLGDILRQDTDGRLVLISGNRDNWNDQLRERFRKTFPDQVDRVLFVPRMGSEDFIRLMGLADALLDTSHFCGGFSSTEAFAAGLAIVTWPGAFMRGRVTYAQYKAMGITDLIAEDGVQYTQLALRLAQDQEFGHDIKNRIAENGAVLFENIAVVREIERFFISALEAANAGQALEGW